MNLKLISKWRFDLSANRKMGLFFLNFFIVSLLVLPVRVAAIQINLTGRPLPTISIDQEKLLQTIKTKYEIAVNKVISSINQAQVYIEGLPVPEGYSCDSSAYLQTVEDYLTGQLVKMDQATTLANVKAIASETATYLKTNKSQIQAAVTNYTKCVYTASLDSVEVYLDSARVQSLILSKQGKDVTELNAAIASAQSLVDQSSAAYAAAKYSQAYALLAQTAPYLQEINTILYL